MRSAFPVLLACCLVATLTETASPRGGADYHRHVKMRSSWPHLNGERDMNYDHLIVPGNRIGPVEMGGSVQDAVNHLGNPDSIDWLADGDTIGGNGEVYYEYKKECIWFAWVDQGLDPKIESGMRGINVTCDQWRTADGIHVGVQPTDAVHDRYCAINSGGDMEIELLNGIEFIAKDRYSPIKEISVVPQHDKWWLCHD